MVENEAQTHYETNYTIKVKKKQLSIARILHENHSKHCLTLWNQISSGFVICCGRFTEATQLLLLKELVFLKKNFLLCSAQLSKAGEKIHICRRKNLLQTDNSFKNLLFIIN